MKAEAKAEAKVKAEAKADPGIPGIVRKGIGGFYYVDTSEGIVRAKGRGVLRLDGVPITVGDSVTVVPPAPGDDDGVILSIEPRKNRFDRPPVSNVDALIIVTSAKDPEPNLFVLDKLLVMAEMKGVIPAVCVNKADLADPGSAEALRAIYSGLYETFLTDGISGSGADEIRAFISGRNVAFAGPSGVGKSTLTNLLVPDAEMDTGGVSRKTARGRHTTRHVEMFPVNGGYLFDTPGFTSFDLKYVEERDLGSYFPEIAKLSGQCRFEDCMHLGEPECAVRDALKSGAMSSSRYRSYQMGIEEIRRNRKY